MKVRAGAVHLVVLMGVLTSCSSWNSVRPGRGADETRARISALEAELYEARKRATMAEVELERARRELDALRTEASGVAGRGEWSAAPTQEAPPQIEPVREDAAARQRDGDRGIEVMDLPSESRSPAPSPDAEPTPEVRGGQGAAVSTSAARRPSAAGQAAYDRGYTLFHQGRYLDAESAFQQFLAEYGDTDLADNAQFWIGEARFARGDLRSALAAFRETVARYPGGNKVPDALLKSADCLRDLGDLEGARSTYAEVMRKYPATAASAVAEERLAGLP